MTTPATGPVRSDFADDPTFHELLEEFAAAMPVRRDGLLEAHQNEDWELLRTRAHQLKGAGGGFGFPRLSEVALELETACRSQDPAQIAGALEVLVGLLNRVTA